MTSFLLLWEPDGPSHLLVSDALLHALSSAWCPLEVGSMRIQLRPHSCLGQVSGQSADISGCAQTSEGGSLVSLQMCVADSGLGVAACDAGGHGVAQLPTSSALVQTCTAGRMGL